MPPRHRILAITAYPDDRSSTATLVGAVAALQRSERARASLWALRSPGALPVGFDRDVDALRRWPPAAALSAIGVRRAAAWLQGLRLRTWMWALRPTAVILDDGIGHRVLVGSARRAPVIVRRNLRPPAQAEGEAIRWEGDGELRLPGLPPATDGASLPLGPTPAAAEPAPEVSAARVALALAPDQPALTVWPPDPAWLAWVWRALRSLDPPVAMPQLLVPEAPSDPEGAAELRSTIPSDAASLLHLRPVDLPVAAAASDVALIRLPGPPDEIWVQALGTGCRMLTSLEPDLSAALRTALCSPRQQPAVAHGAGTIDDWATQFLTFLDGLEGAGGQPPG